MSAEALLDEALEIVIAKAQRQLAEVSPPTAKPAMVVFEWTGGGLPIAAVVDPITLLSIPTSADPVLVEVPFPAQIVWAHMYAGDAAGLPVPVSATVDLQLTSLGTFGTSVPLYGSGVAPIMTNVTSADIPITGWLKNVVPGDTIIAKLAYFSGLATWVALTLLLRPTQDDIAVAAISNNAGSTLTTLNGVTMVYRTG